MCKRWTYEEELTLKMWCDVESIEQLAIRLNRSPNGVKGKMFAMNLKKKKVYRPKVWTEEKENFLKWNGHKQSTKSIARKLGVSVKAVRTKAVRLGVSLRKDKTKLWSEQEIETLRTYVEQGKSWSDMADELGRTERACQKKAIEQDIHRNTQKTWKTTELAYVHEARLQGLSYRQIARKLNRTEPSVRKRYARYKEDHSL